MSSENLVITPKRPKGDDGYKVFSIRIKEELVARMDDIATRTGRSRNELIGTFIEYALDRCVVETANVEES
ncbi:MAG: ribbon-helix-helix protein, CopG family [Oscillospiraceae bacterium]|jgi:predicted transcriptional regulator|nr:ribbon-helix-helix protein, CopG family [Oscillospiraceae bacterium]